MDLVLYIVAAVVFFALIMTSIALHEVGHLVPGKVFDVKTTQYFVGFGKTLWSRRVGETEYGVKLLPLGGYCRFVGMYPPEKGGDAARSAPPGPASSRAWPIRPGRRNGKTSHPRTRVGCSSRRRPTRS